MWKRKEAWNEWFDSQKKGLSHVVIWILGVLLLDELVYEIHSNSMESKRNEKSKKQEPSNVDEESIETDVVSLDKHPFIYTIDERKWPIDRVNFDSIAFFSLVNEHESIETTNEKRENEQKWRSNDERSSSLSVNSSSSIISINLDLIRWQRRWSLDVPSGAINHLCWFWSHQLSTMNPMMIITKCALRHYQSSKHLPSVKMNTSDRIALRQDKDHLFVSNHHLTVMVDQSTEVSSHYIFSCSLLIQSFIHFSFHSKVRVDWTLFHWSKHGQPLLSSLRFQ